MFEKANDVEEEAKYKQGKMNAFFIDMYALSAVTASVFPTIFGINPIQGVHQKRGAMVPKERESTWENLAVRGETFVILWQKGFRVRVERSRVRPGD